MKRMEKRKEEKRKGIQWKSKLLMGTRRLDRLRRGSSFDGGLIVAVPRCGVSACPRSGRTLVTVDENRYMARDE